MDSPSLNILEVYFMNNCCPVVGIDVAKETCYFSVLSPDSKVYIKPTKVLNTVGGWEEMISIFKKTEEVFKCRPIILLEATGHYSENFLAFLIRKDYQAFLINPLQSHSIKSSGIRKAKTDKLDCVDIAKLYFMIDLKEYVKPDEYIYDLKILTRAYAKFTEEKTSLKNQIHKVLDESLPGYAKIFKDIASSTSLEVLSNYGSPDLLLNADRYELINLIKMSSRCSCRDAEHKYGLLLSCAKDAKETGVTAKSLFTMITFLSDELKYKKQ
jgi:transposase